MTKKDLFKIILKLYGLYSLIGVLIQFSIIGYNSYYELNSYYDPSMFIVPFITLLVIGILLFKPGVIVRLFKLDSGFDNNEVSSNSLDGKSITKMALVAISIYMILENIGPFISQILFSFKKSVSRNNLDIMLESFNRHPLDYNIMISSGICLFLGFLLLTNHMRVINWIERTNEKNSN